MSRLEYGQAQNRLEEMGLELPVPAAALAAYVPVVRSQNLLFVSGQLSMNAEGIIKGRLGDNMSLESAQSAAKAAALGVLAQVVHTAKIPLDEIARVIKISVFVASTPDFNEHHLVANGASEMIAAVLGDRGKHARAAFGVAALPLGAAVEIEAIVEIAK